MGAGCRGVAESREWAALPCYPRRHFGANGDSGLDGQFTTSTASPDRRHDRRVTLRRAFHRAPEERTNDQALSIDDWANLLNVANYGGVSYPFLSYSNSLPGTKEEIGAGFAAYVQGAYRSNGVVFACMLTRLMAFSEARFQFRRMRNGRPGELFGTAELDILDHPWSGATTGDLLTRAIQDADLAGNFFAVRRGNQIKRMRPDWVTIVAGSLKDPDLTMDHLDAELLGYIYHPGGPRSQAEPEFLGPNEVCHFAPIPDPLFSYRGMSWVEPVIREVMADGGYTSHKLKFLEHGATPNLAVMVDPSVTKEMFDRVQNMFEQKHAGVMNAYKTIFMGGGVATDLKVIGADMKQMDFKVVQGAGETRVCMASKVPPMLVGCSEGLQASTYANYDSALRWFADSCMRPLWRNMAGSLERIINIPGGANLWYDDRDIPFLRRAAQDQATIQQAHASTISTLVNSGYTPDSVIDAVTSGDFSRLVHTGLYSVQLQPPGQLGEPGGPASIEPPTALPGLPAPAPTAPNGNGKAPAAVGKGPS